MAKQDPKSTTVRVSTIGIPTRRRADLTFTPTPRIVTVSPEQLAVLKADRALAVIPITGGDTAAAAELAELTALADRHKAEAIKLRRHLDAALEQLAEHGIQFAPPTDEAGGELEAGEADDFGAPPSPDGGDTAPRSTRRKARDGAVRASLDG